MRASRPAIALQSTPWPRRKPIEARPSGLSGTTLAIRTVCPSPASATATLASAPPTWTSSRPDWNRSWFPGAERRSRISPKTTVSAGKPAAVDREDVAVDIVGRRRGEEHRRAAEVVGPAPPPRGDALEDLPVA